jgi:hypothetical protein
MATVNQIKSPIRVHSDHDNGRFKTADLQISAYEARLGHTQLAQNIKILLKKSVALKQELSVSSERYYSLSREFYQEGVIITSMSDIKVLFPKQIHILYIFCFKCNSIKSRSECKVVKEGVILYA